MFDTLQEHLDHEAGCFASEHAAAYDLSRREFDNGMAAIKAATNAGLFVVAVGHVAYCRFTDAALPGMFYGLESSHATREEAAKAAEKVAGDLFGDGGQFEGTVEVFPRPEPVACAMDDGSDDITF